LSTKKMHLKAVLAAASVLLATAAPSAAESSGRSGGGAGEDWSASWATAPQYPWTGFGQTPNWSLEGFEDHSVRQVVRLSSGGARARIRLSNRHGTQPLRIAGATIAKAAEGPSIVAGSARPLKFDGRPSTTIPAGDETRSDPVDFASSPLDEVTVTLYLEAATGPATYHNAAQTTTYRAPGDHRFDRGGDAYAERSESWYYLTGVEVLGRFDAGAGTVVAFGDSLTDGYGMAVGADNRYPDELAELYVEAGQPTAVANLGINGNKLRVSSPCFGPSGVDRFHIDALDQPAVRAVVVSIGLNDIGSGGWTGTTCGANPVVTAADVINGHRRLIRLARDRGLKVIGATLTPMKGSDYFSSEKEDVRDAVNAWIRTSGEYDAVADFERALASPDDRDALNPAYDHGDHLHPNDAGRRVLAETVLAALEGA